MTRSQSREQALKIVFQHHFNSELNAQEIADLNLEADDTETDEFALTLAQSVFDNMDKLDEVISSKLVRWTMERLPLMSVAILRLAVAEILYSPDAQDGAIANEAVDFAKKYVGIKEAGFVNGLLGSVIKDKNHGAEEKTEAPVSPEEKTEAPAEE